MSLYQQEQVAASGQDAIPAANAAGAQENCVENDR